MEERNWLLELSLEGQDDVSVKDHICFPLYYNNYEDAIRTILLKVLRAKKEQSDYGKKFPYIIYNAEEGNIIPFLGRRGSGKTTAMVEFCEILKKLSIRNEYNFWVEHAILEDDLRKELEDETFEFRVLQRIDVSSLESKEDIFELIMSELYQMYKTLRGEYNGNFRSKEEQQQILAKFHKIMKGYYAIRDSHEEEFGDSYISKLDYMYSSFNLRNQIDDLIVEIFERAMGCTTNYFVVIVLDDLDLNISHGYDMLEQLHKYFFNQHILITLSADYEQLNRICKYHYIRDFSIGKSHVIESLVKDACAGLARDYITKIMPVDSRIFMPDWNKMVRKIVIKTDDGTQRFVKAYVIGKLAKKMNIYHDINGLKRHFVEQDTVRELVKYNQFIESLLDVPFDDWRDKELPAQMQKDFMERYDQNHERYNNDILNRLANHLLAEEEWKKFQNLIGLDLERRAARTCEIFFNERVPKDGSRGNKQNHKDASDQDTMEKFFAETNAEHSAPVEFLELQLQESPEEAEAGKETDRKNSFTGIGIYDEQHDYAFGVLLQGIYEYGRTSDANKAFVKCVLASFTSEMVREKISFTRNPVETSRAKSFRRLSRFLGNRVGSPWLADMMPELMSDDGQTVRTGYYDFDIAGKQSVMNILHIPSSLVKQISPEYFGSTSSGAINDRLMPLREKMEKDRVVPSLEFLRLFLSINKQEEFWGFPFSFTVEESMQSTQERISEDAVMEMQLKDQPMVFSIWEFLRKTISLDDFLDSFHEKLGDEMSEAICKYMKWSNNDVKESLRSIITKWIKELSLFRNYRKDDVEEEVFPFYDLDMAYNVIKRARRDLLEENRTVKLGEDLLPYVGKVYEMIEKYLRDEDKKYKEDADIETDFAGDFASFPMVSIITDGSYREILQPGVINFLNKLLAGDFGAYYDYVQG